MTTTQRQMQAESQTQTGAADMSISPHELIASDRVEGTNVYRSDGTKIGHIERIMLDKRSGQAAYAVMNFGGFLGLGEDSYRCPGRSSPITLPSAATRSTSPTSSSRAPRIFVPTKAGTTAIAIATR